MPLDPQCAAVLALAEAAAGSLYESSDHKTVRANYEAVTAAFRHQVDEALEVPTSPPPPARSPRPPRQARRVDSS